MNLALLDQCEVLTHNNILRIGEKIRAQEEDAAEDSRQRAIRSTEEVVRREESQKWEEQLSRIKEEWKKEKQRFFQEAHQSQLRAIARQTALLEERLKKEFQGHLDEVEAEHRAHLEKTVQDTWEEAGVVRERAVAEARLEEQQLAEAKARRVADRVAEEKRKDKEQAERVMAQALEERTEYMEEICRKKLAQQREELEEQHAARMTATSSGYEARIAQLEQRLADQMAENERLSTDLEKMTESRDDWELQYKNLKLEFADFIDQFPGFRAEFILK